MVDNISVDEALAMIKSGDAVLVDVREPDEFKSEHIAYAISIPLSTLEDGFKSLDLPLGKTILFQCLKGGRGKMACERIQGVEHCKNKVLNIEGGIEAWKKKNLPVISVPGLSNGGTCNLFLFRQVHAIVGSLVAILVVLGFMGITLAFVIAGILGSALFIAGATGWCGLSILLSKMPWNKHIMNK